MKKDYIQNFVLNDRGKEAVFMDMCDKNDIEPTKEFCQKLLGSDSRKAREYYICKTFVDFFPNRIRKFKI